MSTETITAPDVRKASDNLSLRETASAFAAGRKARRSSASASTGTPNPAPPPASEHPAAPAADTPEPPQTAPAQPEVSDKSSEVREPPPSGVPPSPLAPPAPEPSPLAPRPSDAEPPEVQGLLDDAKAGKTAKEMAKRIHDLVDQRDAERNARLEVERRLAAMESGASPPARTPTSDVGAPASTDLAQFDQRIENLDKLIDWCDTNPDGGQLQDAKGNPVELSPQDVRRYQRTWEKEYIDLVADRRAAKLVAEQRQALAQARALESAVAKYPWINEPTAPEYAEAVSILTERPWLKAQPDAAMLIGEMVTGRMAVRPGARSSGSPARPRPNGEPAPVAAAPAAPARPRTVEQSVEEAQAQFAKEGSVKNLGKLFATQRRLKRAEV